MLIYIKKKLHKLRYYINNMSHLPVGLLSLCVLVVALSSSCTVFYAEETLDRQTSNYHDDSKANISKDIHLPLATPTSTPELSVKPTPTSTPELSVESTPTSTPELTIEPRHTGIGHAWNMVSLYDEWYHIDVTWDDPVPDQENRVKYNYFLLRDEDMEDDHYWKKSDYPKCNSSDYLYYIYEDFIVDSVDNIEVKFMEEYDSGIREITLLYPENEMPDFSFMYNYDYLWT